MRLFLANGYASTTVAAIAEQSGVSVETIYKAFGGKAGLVRAISEQALAGDGPEPTEVASDRMRDREADPHRIVRGWTRLGALVLPRVAPIQLVVRSAAGSDPEMAQLRRDVEDLRLARMTVNATFLATHGHLRDGVTVEHARDVMFVCTSPELYELLVLRQGWTDAQYADFTATTMIAELLQP